MRSIAFVLAAVALPAAVVGAPGPAQDVVPSPVAAKAAPPQSYTFPSGSGMLFFYVKPDMTADFEAVVDRLADALDHATDPMRKAQAANWRIFKSVETTSDAAVYLFVFDPAVIGGDYDPVKVLSEKQPPDLQALYDKLKASTIRVERMGLTKLR